MLPVGLSTVVIRNRVPTKSPTAGATAHWTTTPLDALVGSTKVAVVKVCGRASPAVVAVAAPVRVTVVVCAPLVRRIAVLIGRKLNLASTSAIVAAAKSMASV